MSLSSNKRKRGYQSAKSATPTGHSSTKSTRLDAEMNVSDDRTKLSHGQLWQKYKSLYSHWRSTKKF
eukprot:scaffold10194_cov279-Chaetoceros_neogracile.AAC.2